MYLLVKTTYTYNTYLPKTNKYLKAMLSLKKKG